MEWPFKAAKVRHRMGMAAILNGIACVFLYGGTGFMAIGEFLAGIVWLGFFGLTAIPVVLMSKSLIRMMCDPANLPVDWTSAKAREIFNRSIVIVLMAVGCVGLAAAGIYLIGWERLYVWGILSFAGMIALLRRLRFTTSETVKEFGFPTEAEISYFSKS